MNQAKPGANLPELDRYSRAQGTDTAELRVHSEGLEAVPLKNKFQRSKKRSMLGNCKRQKATRAKEMTNVASSAQG